MRPWLKAIIMILVIAALGASGIFVYARLAGNNPVEVTPANYWTLHYMPNQSYIYGIVVSDESQALYKSGDATQAPDAAGAAAVRPGDVAGGSRGSLRRLPLICLPAHR